MMPRSESRPDLAVGHQHTIVFRALRKGHLGIPKTFRVSSKGRYTRVPLSQGSSSAPSGRVSNMPEPRANPPQRPRGVTRKRARCNYTGQPRDWLHAEVRGPAQAGIGIRASGVISPSHFLAWGSGEALR